MPAIDKGRWDQLAAAERSLLQAADQRMRDIPSY